MPSRVNTHVVKVTGVSDEQIRMLDARVSARRYRGRAEYIRELIRRDALAGSPSRLDEVVCALQEQSSKMSEEELDDIFEQARNGVYSENATEAAPSR
jgi:Arc/MetJ-type ribon-helix-helix transcriptional regulator